MHGGRFRFEGCHGDSQCTYGLGAYRVIGFRGLGFRV